jgi:hypothetical protein
MRLFRRKQKGLPKSFYDKGADLLKQASNIPDQDAKKVALEAVKKYFEADVKPREPFIGTLFSLLVPYVVVFGTAVWAFRSLSFIPALAVVVSSFSLLALIVGAALRAAGYISESGFLGIVKEGFKTLLLMRKRQ